VKDGEAQMSSRYPVRDGLYIVPFRIMLLSFKKRESEVSLEKVDSVGLKV
jgi:hypothetical protein